MKLKSIEEKPFNWIEGFEGVYLMNEDKLIKRTRLTVMVGRKKQIYEATYIPTYKNEEGELAVKLSSKLIGKLDKEKEYLIKDLTVLKYTRTREHTEKTKKRR